MCISVSANWSGFCTIRKKCFEGKSKGNYRNYRGKVLYLGMHVHMLLLKDGQPVFSDDEGYAHLSKEAHWFMGGLLKHIASLLMPKSLSCAALSCATPMPPATPIFAMPPS